MIKPSSPTLSEEPRDTCDGLRVFSAEAVFKLLIDFSTSPRLASSLLYATAVLIKFSKLSSDTLPVLDPPPL